MKATFTVAYYTLYYVLPRYASQGRGGGGENIHTTRKGGEGGGRKVGREPRRSRMKEREREKEQFESAEDGRGAWERWGVRYGIFRIILWEGERVEALLFLPSLSFLRTAPKQATLPLPPFLLLFLPPVFSYQMGAAGGTPVDRGGREEEGTKKSLALKELFYQRETSSLFPSEGSRNFWRISLFPCFPPPPPPHLVFGGKTERGDVIFF